MKVLILSGSPRKHGNFISCFHAGGNREGGYVFGFGTTGMRDVEKTPALGQAYELGRSVVETPGEFLPSNA